MTIQTERLLRIMGRLREPHGGCSWDLAQTFATIAPYTIEEAYEVADAIARGDMQALREELGDLLFQVVFHARIAEEAGQFAFDDVAAAISDKMEARHPHVFHQAHAFDQAQVFDQDPLPGLSNDEGHAREQNWESRKAEERAARGQAGILDGVALALPALMRAEKLQKRAARAGFDWPDPAGAEEKLREEMVELAEADNAEARMEEAGDLLFAAVNLIRKHGIAPENALRAANTKFERRFRAMESMAREQGLDFGALPIDSQENLWQRVKSSEAGKTP